MQRSDKPIVFDASVVLAVALHEPGHHVVRGIDGLVLLSAVNLTEVRSRLLDLGKSAASIDGFLTKIGISIVPFDAEQARLAGDLRAATRAFGLSLGDRACLALGVMKDAAVYTADRVWARIALPIEVRVIR